MTGKEFSYRMVALGMAGALICLFVMLYGG